VLDSVFVLEIFFQANLMSRFENHATLFKKFNDISILFFYKLSSTVNECSIFLIR